MSGVVLDVPVAPARPGFFRLLGPLLCAYVVAAIALVVFGFALQRVGVLPGALAHSGPFPVDGAWSFASDVAAATVVVLVVAALVRASILLAGLGPLSYGGVVVIVAVTGYVPLLAFRELSLLSLLATTWAVRRYAMSDAGLRLPWRVWVAVAVVAFGVFASYGVYHPLAADRWPVGLDARASGTLSIPVTLDNPGLADVTILRVDGGYLAGRWRTHSLPWTLGGRSQTTLVVFHKGCVSPDVTVTYSVLGLTSSRRFTVGSLSSCQR